ncbi:MAG: hypothetical protein IIA30_16735 [Myxococcales bacterium]|nr:hypothetical protein [Myxococcales bacterium]
MPVVYRHAELVRAREDVREQNGVLGNHAVLEYALLHDAAVRHRVPIVVIDVVDEPIGVALVHHAPDGHAPQLELYRAQRVRSRIGPHCWELPDRLPQLGHAEFDESDSELRVVRASEQGDRVDLAHPDAEPGPAYLPELDQVLHDPVREVDGNREPVTLVESRLAGDGGVDSDDLPSEVHHRPAGIAGVDHGVRLDEVLDRVSGVAPRRLVLPESAGKQLKGTPESADDPHGHRVIQGRASATEAGVADGHDPLPDTEIGGAPEVELGQPRCVDLDHRNVRERIPSHHLGLERAPILKKNGEKVRALDDVVVGQDVTILGDDESASPGDAIRLVRAILVRAKKSRTLRPGGRNLPSRRDPHDRRRDDFGDVDERITEVECRLHGLDRDLGLATDDGHRVGTGTPPEGGRDSKPHDSRCRSVEGDLHLGA